jgi:hypothetical protein
MKSHGFSKAQVPVFGLDAEKTHWTVYTTTLKTLGVYLGSKALMLNPIAPNNDMINQEPFQALLDATIIPTGAAACSTILARVVPCLADHCLHPVDSHYAQQTFALRQCDSMASSGIILRNPRRDTTRQR